MPGKLTTPCSKNRWPALARDGFDGTLWACCGAGVAARAGEELRYHWKPEQEYVYSVNIIETGRSKVQQRGIARFRSDSVPARIDVPTNR